MRRFIILLLSVVGAAAILWVAVAKVGMPLWKHHLYTQAVRAVEAADGSVDINITYGLVVSFRYKSNPSAALKHVKDLTGIVAPLPFGMEKVDPKFEHLRDKKGLGILSVESTTVTDDDLAVCESQPGLKLLWLQETNITDAGLAHIKNCREIVQMDLYGTKISDAGLENLGEMHQLHKLGLANNPQITDAAIPWLTRIGSLQELDITGTSITKDGYARLKKGFWNIIIHHDFY